jgi:hypothetical protein
MNRSLPLLRVANFLKCKKFKDWVPPVVNALPYFQLYMKNILRWFLCTSIGSNPCQPWLARIATRRMPMKYVDIVTVKKVHKYEHYFALKAQWQLKVVRMQFLPDKVFDNLRMCCISQHQLQNIGIPNIIWSLC